MQPTRERDLSRQSLRGAHARVVVEVRVDRLRESRVFCGWIIVTAVECAASSLPPAPSSLEEGWVERGGQPAAYAWRAILREVELGGGGIGL